MCRLSERGTRHLAPFQTMCESCNSSSQLCNPFREYSTHLCPVKHAFSRMDYILYVAEEIF